MVKRRHNRRWIGWLMFSMLVVVVITIVVKNNFFDGSSTENQNLNPNTTEREGNNVASSGYKNTEENIKETEEEKKDILQYAGDSPNKAGDLTGVISYADVVEGELIIRVNINQFLTTGICKLSMTKNGANVYSETTDIEESVTTSTCNGFKIPVNKLTSGDLQIEIDLESDGREGKITGKVRI